MNEFYKFHFMSILILALFLSGCNKTKEKENHPELLIAAAASLQNVMEELQALYKDQNKNVNVTFTFGSSGSLQQQIQQGAPIDVFISAAQKNMNILIEEDLVIESTKIELLENIVVLIVPKESKLSILSFDDIMKASMVAIGDPDSVPAGQYAVEVFTSLSILDELKSKVTYAKDVTEVLTWVSTGNLDAGVVYATDAKESEDVKVVAEAPEGSCSRVVYPAAIIKDTKQIEAATDFMNFLLTKEAKEIFEQYGFTIYE